MVHSHTVHLPLGALLSPCTTCVAQAPLPADATAELGWAPQLGVRRLYGGDLTGLETGSPGERVVGVVQALTDAEYQALVEGEAPSPHTAHSAHRAPLPSVHC